MTNCQLFPELYRYLPYWLAASINWVCDQIILAFVVCVLAPAAMFSMWVMDRQARSIVWKEMEVWKNDKKNSLDSG